MAQLPDRWPPKFLTLPIFSDGFAQAIQRSPHANLALFSAMEARSVSEFVVKVHEWEASLDAEITDDLLRSSFMLKRCECLASSVEKAFFESTVCRLGFGMCDPVTHALSTDSARARRRQALKSLLNKLSAPPRKILSIVDLDLTTSPLVECENASRWKWVAELEQVGKRNGAHFKLLCETAYSEGLSVRLRQPALSSGAPEGRQHISLPEKGLMMELLVWRSPWMIARQLVHFCRTPQCSASIAQKLGLVWCPDALRRSS